jgi:predicted nucleic acid-binding protein
VIVLVDTSIWIRSFRPARYPAIAERLARFLDEEAVAAHPFVYGELILRGRNRVRLLEDYLRLQHQTTLEPEERVLALVFQHSLQGPAWDGWTAISSLPLCTRRRHSGPRTRP